ncbi:uncharacterized protein lrrc53 [Sphaeramia orbicularis]|uniref:uncharacterized protein lrrc53 n=1 Tax=Sphaeramia orbicularis TaxID=375764 RepID=UPI00117BFF65|nr:leucine-rich repeat-containing protein 53 [Sphaeramia orbicularis]
MVPNKPGLSHNHISVLDDQSFRNLPFLHTLLLDHNLLTTQALQGGALTNLTQLEVLTLGNNRISMIDAEVFKGTTALRILKLEGNQLTRLDSDSFPLNDFRAVESLDLSENFIDYLDGNSFRGLVALQTLDLSRNRLSSAPPEAFSYLSRLTNLNLDLNSWNCSCQQVELAAFLSDFMQHPDKTLYNGRRMVCVSADNPAVTTVLELTEANCVPSNQNIRVKIEPRSTMSPQHYSRDLAITAVICFAGGVGLTLLIVFIHHRMSRRKKLKQQKIQEEREEGSSTMANHNSSPQEGNERRQDFPRANGSQSWDKEAMMVDTRLEHFGGQYRCPECREEEPRPNPIRWSRMNGGIELMEERRRMRTMMEEERRRPGPQQGMLGRPGTRGNSNYNYDPRREAFSQRSETLVGYKTVKELDSYSSDVEGKNRGNEAFHCESCHRTYRSDQNTKQGGFHSSMRDSGLVDGFPYQNRLSDRGRNINYNEGEMIRNSGLKREIRNVKFDLERTDQGGRIQQEDRKEEEAKSPRDKDRRGERKHKTKVQSSRLLKVKLNLNPLRKSKVHPKRKSEQGKGSPKRSKEKRKEGKDKGDKERKGKKSSKSKGSNDDGEEKEGESSKQKKNTSKTDQEGKESTGQDQNQDQNSQNTVDQSQPTSAQPGFTGQGTLGGAAQFQGGGFVVGGTQFPPQHPFSLAAMDRNRTTNLSMLGSQRTGSSLSLQGGNFLLNAGAPGVNPLLPSGPTNPMAPNLTFSGPNMVPSGAPDGLIRQSGVGPASSVTSLLTNPMHASSQNISQPAPDRLMGQTGAAPALSAASLPANPIQRPASNLVPNPPVNPPTVQSDSKAQKPPDSSPQEATVKSDPVQGPGLQSGEGASQQPSDSQAPQTKENPVNQTQTPVGPDGSSVAVPQTSAPVTVVQNLPKNNSQTELGRGPGDVSALGVTLTDGPSAGASVGSMQAADESVSGVSAPGGSAETGSSTGLLQQEYLSEEAGSSPRRKLKLVIPEKTSSRPPTALERKIR